MPIAPPYAVVWAVFVFAWIGNYLVRMVFSAVLPAIIGELGLSYTQAGVLASVFFGAYACSQFPAGLLGDRFGRRRVLVLGLVAGALASGLTGFAASFAALLGARVVTGLSQGSLFANDRAIITSVTPREKIALGQAVSFTGPGLGITLGLLLGGLLGDIMPWRAVFWVVALPPLVAAALVHRMVPAGEATPDRLAGHGGLRAVFATPDVWLVGVAGACLMWVQYVLATWAPLLYMEVGVRDAGHAAVLASLQGLAGVVGLTAGGFASDVGARRGVPRKAAMAASLLIAAVAMALTGLVVRRGVSPAALTVAILVGAVGAWSFWGPSFAVLGESVGPRHRSTAFGLYNGVCVLGAFVGPALTGWTRDVTGSFTAGCWVSAAVAAAGVAVTLAVRGRPASTRAL